MMELKIAEKLRFYRRKAGYTQEEMAAHLGVSFQAISKWERGYGYPDITMLPALAKYFGISVYTAVKCSYSVVPAFSIV